MTGTVAMHELSVPDVVTFCLSKAYNFFFPLRGSLNTRLLARLCAYHPFVAIPKLSDTLLLSRVTAFRLLSKGCISSDLLECALGLYIFVEHPSNQNVPSTVKYFQASGKGLSIL